MATKVKIKICKECGARFTPKYSTLQKYCSSKCTYKNAKPKKTRQKINPVSKKRKAEQKKYKQRRLLFLSKPENKICFIDGCTKKSTTVEHRAGRGINYLNEETWAGCCLEHNLELENNPELSKKYQLSKIHGGKKI